MLSSVVKADFNICSPIWRDGGKSNFHHEEHPITSQLKVLYIKDTKHREILGSHTNK